MTNAIPHDARLSAIIRSDPVLNDEFGHLLKRRRPRHSVIPPMENGFSTIPKEEAKILDQHYGLPQPNPSLFERITSLFQRIFSFFESLFINNKPSETQASSSESSQINDTDILDMYYQPVFGKAIKEEPN